jgi:hypothetical protein
VDDSAQRLTSQQLSPHVNCPFFPKIAGETSTNHLILSLPARFGDKDFANFDHFILILIDAERFLPFALDRSTPDVAFSP